MKLIPVASDGWRFIIPLTLVGLVLLRIGNILTVSLAGICFLATVFSLYFFRDFDRSSPNDSSLIIAPGDGKILGIETIIEGENKDWKLVRIFLSVFDGHIQRSPVSGTVKKIEYQKGLYLDARHPQAHLQNEKNVLTIVTPNGEVVVTQIAGLIARRIVSWVKTGATLSQGERYGLIRFGSQVDVLMPPHVEVSVQMGQRVWGGMTPIAKWKL
ncbi:MAG: phosphatidylserine decarboxylase [Elusimicrobiota bacterium]